MNLEKRIESLEKESADHDITLMQIKDRIRDIEQSMKEKEEKNRKVIDDLAFFVKMGRNR